MGEEFKLPTSSYEELIKIIQAYGKATEPSSNDGISKLCSIYPTIISGNNGFLLAVNIIEGAKNKIATDKGKNLARALQYENQDEIAKIWREIVLENDFLSKMISAIKIRKGMDAQSFQSHIAYSSGQDKTKYVKTGSATVIDILKKANLIEEIDGKLTAKLPVEKQTGSITVPTAEPKADVSTPIFQTKNQPQGNMTVNIEVRIDVNINELDDLGVKLRKVLDDLNERQFTPPCTNQ